MDLPGLPKTGNRDLMGTSLSGVAMARTGTGIPTPRTVTDKDRAPGTLKIVTGVMTVTLPPKALRAARRVKTTGTIDRAGGITTT